MVLSYDFEALENDLERSKNELMKNPKDVEQWLISAKCHRALKMNDFAIIDLERMERFLEDQQSNSRMTFSCYMEFMENFIELNRLDLARLYLTKSLYLDVNECPDIGAIKTLSVKLAMDFPQWEEEFDNNLNLNSAGRFPKGYDITFLRHVDLDLLNEELRKVSRNLIVSTTGENQFGIFALKSIKKGELLLNEKTRICVTSASDRCENCSKSVKGSFVTCKRCETRFCSADCMKEALSSYHLLVCSKVKSESYQEVIQTCKRSRTGAALYVMLLVRIYAIAIKENVSPSDVSEVKTLCSADSFMFKRIYNYNLDTFYFRLLELFNISPFQPCGRFDFQTYKCVVSKFMSNIFANMRAEDPDDSMGMYESSHLFRFASFFNHSCDPNANDEIVGNKMVVTARRNIKKGEEVFIAYTSKSTKVMRGKTLLATYGFDCKCTSCLNDKSPSFLQTSGGSLDEFLK